MIRSKINRRRHPRVRVDRTIQVPLQIFPVLPFLGESLDAHLLNISSGGMALLLKFPVNHHNVTRGTKIKIHFRLPGYPLFECGGEITRHQKTEQEDTLLGVRFTKRSRLFTQTLHSLGTTYRASPFEIAFQHID